MRALLLTGLVLAIGCGPEGETRTALVAVDCSGSAQPFMPEFVKAARDVNETLRGGETLELYRFDTGVNEIYVGRPLEGAAFKRRMEVLNRDRQERGTSLVKLMERLDARVGAAPGKRIEIHLLTDCGIEGMKPAEHERVRAIARGWGENPKVASFTVGGVRPFHRDALRADLEPLGAKLTIR